MSTLIESSCIRIVVYGEAKAAGSKNARAIWRNVGNGMRQIVTRADGSPVLTVSDANEKSRDWKNAVASAARDAYQGVLLTGPLSVVFRFYRPRPKSHYGKSSLNKTGRDSIAPTMKPDVLKLARAVEDALTSTVWRDDSQIIKETIEKNWGEPARVEIFIDQNIEADSAE